MPLQLQRPPQHTAGEQCVQCARGQHLVIGAGRGRARGKGSETTITGDADDAFDIEQLLRGRDHVGVARVRAQEQKLVERIRKHAAERK